jgi:predicted  nucleic acid-binding Zn-ribbon protein
VSSINWPEILAIFIGFGAFFIYLMSRLDSFRKDLNDKVEASTRSLSDKIEALQKDINRIDSKVSNIEGQITQMTRPNIVSIKKRYQEEDEPKEN